MSAAWRTVLSCAVWCHAAVAAAHAPLARDLAISADSGVLIRMPGFGILVPAASESGFAFACDALLGLSPEDDAVLSVNAAGDLLVGSATLGPRRFDVSNCTARAGLGWPAGIGVAAMAHDPTLPSRHYAATAERSARVLISDDAGASWTLLSTLAEGPLAASLHALAATDTEPASIVLVREADAGRTEVLRSEDGGVSFVPMELARDLRVVHAQSGSQGGLTLWAHGERIETREVELLRVRLPEGNVEIVHRVLFFGGFAIDETTGTAWIADEAGDLFRSDDGGDSFHAVSSGAAIACLRFDGSQLWACASGTSEEPALLRSEDRGESFVPVVAFAEVTTPIACDAPSSEPQVCAAAWREWRADVLPRVPMLEDDAGNEFDAGTRPHPTSDGACQCSTVGAKGRARSAPSMLVVLAGLVGWLLLSAAAHRRARKGP